MTVMAMEDMYQQKHTIITTIITIIVVETATTLPMTTPEQKSTIIVKGMQNLWQSTIRDLKNSSKKIRHRGTKWQRDLKKVGMK